MEEIPLAIHAVEMAVNAVVWKTVPHIEGEVLLQ
jgi:hypothetical protein